MIERAQSSDEALRKLGVTLKAKRHGAWLRTQCPFCPDGAAKRSNFAVRIDNDGVAYHCHRCGESGKVWIDDGAQDQSAARKLAGKKGDTRSSTCDWRPKWDGPWRR